MKFRCTNIIYIFGIWLSFSAVFAQNEEKKSSPPLNAIVPLIEQKYFELRPSEKGYLLIIELLNGSTRADNVELRNSNTPEEELYMTGQTLTIHPTGITTTTYEAGKNGYLASYKFEISAIIKNRLGGVTLKTAAG